NVELRVDVKVTMYTSGRFTAMPSKAFGHERWTACEALPQAFSLVPMTLSLCLALNWWSMRALYWSRSTSGPFPFVNSNPCTRRVKRMVAVFKPSVAGSPAGAAVNSFGEGMRRNVSCMYALLLMAERSGSRKVRQLATGAPLKVQLPNRSMAARSPVAVAGRIGLPFRSTDGLELLALALS